MQTLSSLGFLSVLLSNKNHITERHGPQPSSLASPQQDNPDSQLMPQLLAGKCPEWEAPTAAGTNGCSQELLIQAHAKSTCSLKMKSSSSTRSRIFPRTFICHQTSRWHQQSLQCCLSEEQSPTAHQQHSPSPFPLRKIYQKTTPSLKCFLEVLQAQSCVRDMQCSAPFLQAHPPGQQLLVVTAMATLTFGTGCPGGWLSHHPWGYSWNVYMWHWGTWFASTVGMGRQLDWMIL